MNSGVWQNLIRQLRIHLPLHRVLHTRCSHARGEPGLLWRQSWQCRQQQKQRRRWFTVGSAPAATQRQGPQQAGAATREEHNRRQAEAFDAATVQEFEQPLPADVQQNLRRIAGAAEGLGPSSRVIDVGCGTGALIPFLQERGVRDILAVDLSPAMLAALAARFPPPGTLGNEPGVRTWCGDVVDLPAAQGPADAVFFNACFGNVFDQRAALLAAAGLLRPGGHIVISHPLGREWLAGLAARCPDTVPHGLPVQEQLQAMVHDLPLAAASVVDEPGDASAGRPGLYIATLQVPPRYGRPELPLQLQGVVERGFGRGSRELGFPTANLPLAALLRQLPAAPKGVYFGWAQLRGGAAGSDRPAADFEVQPMVMNVGVRPTMDDPGALTVEVHVMHKYAGDFYGELMRVVVLGFIRPEMKFDGLPALMARIQSDIGIAKAQLADPQLSEHARSPFFEP